jgi:hypothetical protein
MNPRVVVCVLAGLAILYAPLRSAHFLHHAAASIGTFLNALH